METLSDFNSSLGGIMGSCSEYEYIWNSPAKRTNVFINLLIYRNKLKDNEGLIKIIDQILDV